MMAFLSLVVLLVFSTGCVSNRKEVRPVAKPLPRLPSSIDEIHVLAVPVALDFNNIPGPDGFAITVYGGNRAFPKTMPIEKGTIEMLMFDGLLPENSSKPATPLKTWKISAEELKRSMVTTSIGTGYQLSGLWGEAAPTGNKITVAIRYTGPDGTILYSAPSIIAVPTK